MKWLGISTSALISILPAKAFAKVEVECAVQYEIENGLSSSVTRNVEFVHGSEIDNPKIDKSKGFVALWFGRSEVALVAIDELPLQGPITDAHVEDLFRYRSTPIYGVDQAGGGWLIYCPLASRREVDDPPPPPVEDCSRHHGYVADVCRRRNDAKQAWRKRYNPMEDALSQSLAIAAEAERQKRNTGGIPAPAPDPVAEPPTSSIWPFIAIGCGCMLLSAAAATAFIFSPSL